MPRRRLNRLLVLIAIVIALFLAVTARLFVWPSTSSPATADAIVALAGNPPQLNAKKAVSLSADGYAPVVVLSVGGDPPAPCLKGPTSVKVLCFEPNPIDTRGEAEYVARLAKLHHWHKLIVVSAVPQTTRARLMFKRCTNATLLLVPAGVRASQFVSRVVYEWGALLKALFVNTSC